SIPDEFTDVSRDPHAFIVSGAATPRGGTPGGDAARAPGPRWGYLQPRSGEGASRAIITSQWLPGCTHRSAAASASLRAPPVQRAGSRVSGRARPEPRSGPLPPP